MVEQSVDRRDELLNPLALERRDDVVVVDASGVEPVEQGLRLVEIGLEPRLDPAMVLKTRIVSSGMVEIVCGPISSST